MKMDDLSLKTAMLDCHTCLRYGNECDPENGKFKQECEKYYENHIKTHHYDDNRHHYDDYDDGEIYVLKLAEDWLCCNLYFGKFDWNAYDIETISMNSWKSVIESIAQKNDVIMFNKFVSYASDADNNMRFSIQELNDMKDKILDKFAEIAKHTLSVLDKCIDDIGDEDDSSDFIFSIPCSLT